jgi:CubicO group peptidase (beta-lactamase class C family)
MIRRMLPVMVAVVSMTVGMTVSASAAPDRHGGSPHVAGFDHPFSGYMPANTKLREGSLASQDLDAGPIAEADHKVDLWAQNDPKTGHPLFSGAVTMLVHNGVIVHRHNAGMALRYADENGTELPADQQIPMRDDTIFDMASISKLFTSIIALQLAQEHKIDLTKPVAQYLPGYGVNGKDTITSVMLLTHTSGLKPDPVPSLWQGYPDVPSRKAAILNETPQSPPGTAYIYSDENMLSLQLLEEHVTGQPLDKLVRDRITGPLHMVDTGYNPPASKKHRVAAEEYEIAQGRGLVWGSVHDENAWSLDGIAGHAGIFSTADDMAILAQMLLNGGTYKGHRILQQRMVDQMMVNYNTKFPGDDHGLGFELNQRWYMGGLTGTRTMGHTGFTGTTIVIDPDSRSIAIVLTNHVHPNRNWGSVNLAREAVATGLAKAMAVHPVRGHDSWYTGIGDASSATLTTPMLPSTNGSVRVNFSAFVDSEETDPVVLESSSDGTTWSPVQVTANGHGAPSGVQDYLSGGGHRYWWKVSASIQTAGPVMVRWRFTTDARYTGRGINLDGISITQGNRVLLDGEKQPDLLSAQSWQLRSR